MIWREYRKQFSFAIAWKRAWQRAFERIARGEGARMRIVRVRKVEK